MLVSPKLWSLIKRSKPLSKRSPKRLLWSQNIIRVGCLAELGLYSEEEEEEEEE